MSIKYSKGIMWLDDCRIPFVDSDKETINFDRPRLREKKDWVYDLGTTWENPDVKEYNQQGRFSPNLLVCDDMLNDGSVSKTTQKNKVVKNTTQMFNYSTQREYPEISDKGTNSRYYDLDKWFDKVIDNL